MNKAPPSPPSKSESDCKKSILISGKNNRYHMRKLMDGHETSGKSRESTISGRVDKYNKEFFKQEIQRDIVRYLFNTLHFKENIPIQYTEISQKVSEHIRSKLSSYKMQDKLKKRPINEETYSSLASIAEMLHNCNLTCHYCKQDIIVIYETSESREMSQWSLDRLDNELPHDKSNVVISCLDCNLNKRRRSEKAFVFTKQLHIVKHEDKEIESVRDKDVCYEDGSDFTVFNPEEVHSSIEYSPHT
uniref:Uncharacterized protein n=1 Tax=viral metagenome TaxID=1070528 RepID=A0A6C0FCR8_9ZZZZ|tara:strand:- start:2273 stop:3010 length:738 start_codon:yes stop_codon:yes gene_type:complete